MFCKISVNIFFNDTNDINNDRIPGKIMKCRGKLLIRSVADPHSKYVIGFLFIANFCSNFHAAATFRCSHIACGYFAFALAGKSNNIVTLNPMWQKQCNYILLKTMSRSLQLKNSLQERVCRVIGATSLHGVRCLSDRRLVFWHFGCTSTNDVICCMRYNAARDYVCTSTNFIHDNLWQGRLISCAYASTTRSFIMPNAAVWITVGKCGICVA